MAVTAAAKFAGSLAQGNLVEVIRRNRTGRILRVSKYLFRRGTQKPVSELIYDGKGSTLYVYNEKGDDIRQVIRLDEQGMPACDGMLEKRKSPRFSVGAEIRWKRTAADELSEPFISHTRDLSTDGLSALLSPGIAIGDTVQLEIRISDEESIFSRGRIAWVSDRARIKGWAIPAYEGGIELLNLSEADKTSIDRYICKTYGL